MASNPSGWKILTALIVSVGATTVFIGYPKRKDTRNVAMRNGSNQSERGAYNYGEPRPDISTSSENIPCCEEGHGRNHIGPNRLEYVTASGAVLAAVGAFVAAIFAGWQGWTARDQEWRQLRPHLVFASEFDKAGQFLPRLEIERMPLSYPGGYENRNLLYPTGFIEIRNDGQTPALHYENYMAVKKLPVDLPKGFMFPAAEKQYSMQSMGIHVQLFPTLHANPINMVTEQDDFQSGKFAIYVYGTVFYDDFLRIRHFQSYCVYFTQPGWPDNICDTHNGTDDSDYRISTSGRSPAR